MLLDFKPMQDLIGGLVGAGRCIAGGDGSVFAVAAVLELFIYEHLFTVSQFGLAGVGIDSASGHVGHTSSD